MVRYKEISDRHREQLLAARGTIVVSRGNVHHLKDLPGYIAEDAAGNILGMIFYALADEECEIVALNSYRQGAGIDTTLINLVKERLQAGPYKRMWLITTNDNIHAIRFYQKRGFDMKCIHRHAVHEARLVKPSIPLVSDEGIPIQHEIEFEMIL